MVNFPPLMSTINPFYKKRNGNSLFQIRMPTCSDIDILLLPFSFFLFFFLPFFYVGRIPPTSWWYPQPFSNQTGRISRKSTDGSSTARFESHAAGWWRVRIALRAARWWSIGGFARRKEISFIRAKDTTAIRLQTGLNVVNIFFLIRTRFIPPLNSVQIREPKASHGLAIYGKSNNQTEEGIENYRMETRMMWFVAKFPAKIHGRAVQGGRGD